MKRSEMIDILDEAINSNLYQDYLFDKDMLNSVLIAIEKAGMLPPPNSTDVANGRILYCYYNDIENVEDRLVEIDGSYGILDLKKSILWEPE